MIEKYLIKNDLTLKRWRRFKSLKRAVAASWVFLFLIFLSATAEFWANSAPIVMSYEGEVYWPLMKTYHPTVFGQTDTLVTDYRKLNPFSDWSIWPPVQWNPLESNLKVDSFPSSPTMDNLFGTDDRGRDVLARLLYGFRYSIGFALLVWVLSYSFGIVAGSFMGYFGGWVDLTGQRLVEVFESMPLFLLLITLVSIFGASLWLLVVFSAIFGWMMISIYVRAEFLKLRKREFVESARALGGGTRRVVFKHILPNALGPVVTFSPFTIAGAITGLANLDYLGFGLPPPTPSWGELLQQAHSHFSVAWWLAVFPSLALFLTLLVLNFIGEGVREAFDPRK